MTCGTTEFSVHDAIEVLRLLDDKPNATFDIRCRGFRLQCVRGAAPSPAGTKQTRASAGEERRRHATVKAPAAGWFSGDAAVFSPGGRRMRVNAGTRVGCIQAAAKVTDITASVEGTIAYACVTPHGFVEYGQTLLVIEVD
jgi:biotin carboxyl carrier protein